MAKEFSAYRFKVPIQQHQPLARDFIMYKPINRHEMYRGVNSLKVKLV